MPTSSMAQDFNTWVAELPESRALVAHERAMRKFPQEFELLPSGFPVPEERWFSYMTDEEGEIIPGVANEDNYLCVLFDEFKIMYLEEIYQNLTRRGLMEPHIQEDGSIDYRPTDEVRRALVG